jgi:hypothetical protein
VAILAGNRQIAMGTMRALDALGLCASRENGNGKNHEENEFEFYPSAHDLHLAFAF